MKNFTLFLSKINLKSIYLKWTFIFTFLLIVAQLITQQITFSFIIPDVVLSINDSLYKKATFIKNLYDQKIILDKQTIEDFADSDMYFFKPDKDMEFFSEFITPEMFDKIQNGEMIKSKFYADDLNTFYAFLIGSDLLIVSNGIENNKLMPYLEAMQTSIFIGSVTGSIFIVIALILIIRPIKKISIATKEIADGNFAIQLKTNSNDEIGQLIKNFNIMTEKLKKNEYLKKDFASNISHEFKTPITSILGFSKLLRDSDFDREHFIEYMNIIIQESERLSSLSENLLKLSILDNTVFENDKVNFSLDYQLEKTILLLEPLWAEKNIDFTIEMIHTDIFGNEELLLQVWINLLENAIKFSSFGGEIKIKLEKTENSIVVTILDYGTGIQKKDCENIFERFYKVDSSGAEKGSGLGLSIVKRILEIYSGTIVLDSEIGKGTLFEVTLPVKSQF